MVEEEVFSDESDFETHAERSLGPLAEGLSHVGQAAREVLSARHHRYKGVCWSVTHGTVVGELAQTPPREYFIEKQITQDLENSHSSFFPEKMSEIICRAEEWVDVTSLGPPDGRFLEALAKALKTLSDSGRSIIVRILTGNIPGMPTDNQQLCRDLTKFPGYELKEDSKIKLWCGSWRKGLSWNHSKLIAVDGKHLFQGGHNMWDQHYLAKNPVRDVSMELQGQVAQDGHMFANHMWEYIIRKSKQKEEEGKVPRLKKSHIGVVQWPPQLDVLPPLYERSAKSVPLKEAIEQGQIPLLSIGRFGTLHHDDASANPADSAIVAMLRAAQKSIKLSLQDLGPIAIPLPTGGSCALPGCPWPQEYLREIGMAIYERGVDVEIVLSNPHSIPAKLSMTEAQYGNGWTCNDVAAEIIRSIQQNVEEIDERKLTGLVGMNLRLAFMRTSSGPMDWEDAKKAGNHAKFFIVDDVCYYLGSQNLYIANLAEWGVVVDNAGSTQQVLAQFWGPVWAASYENVPEEERDFSVDAVFAGLNIDRNPRDMADYSPEELEAILLAKKRNHVAGPEKTLTVWVKRAANLADADGGGMIGGGSDPYVKVRIKDKKGNKLGPAQQTKVIWNEHNPHWNEVLDFEGLENPEDCILHIAVLDKDLLLGIDTDFTDWLDADDKLGKTEVKMGELRNSMDYQDRELVISSGWFRNSTISIALHTRGGWGK